MLPLLRRPTNARNASEKFRKLKRTQKIMRTFVNDMSQVFIFVVVGVGIFSFIDAFFFTDAVCNVYDLFVVHRTLCFR